MARGDHIYVVRVGYTHHGIQVDDDKVVHYNGEPGSSKIAATIREATRVEFLAGGELRVRKYGVRFSPDETVARAYSRLGESGYHLFDNNCEHFATWCVTDKHSSSQVNGAVAAGGVAGTAGTAAAAGIGVITAVGEVGGLSAAGIMSGLATTGGVIGGGAVAGLGVLAAGPAVLSASVMQVALKDDESLTDSERQARAIGRVASVAGAGAGVASGAAVIGAAGSVAGLSAAGITSGLATIGATVGGGMAAGSMIVIAGPAVAAAGVGYGAYRIARALKRRTSTRAELNLE
jgi:hypothetical protein